MLQYLISLDGTLPRRPPSETRGPAEYHIEDCASCQRMTRYDKRKCDCPLRGCTDLHENDDDDDPIYTRYIDGITYYYPHEEWYNEGPHDGIPGLVVVERRPRIAKPDPSSLSLGELVLKRLMTPEGVTRAQIEALRANSTVARGDVVGFMTGKLRKLKMCPRTWALMQANYAKLRAEW